ncbi:hypothetical protein RHGRI_015128 [Rhododendron griersonianum]|uniref:Methyltransferase n=1 Tax=Rhododendron griersonianum TaxID=479676 RepID=A0AAV6KCX9_9ERIC|nr:hypothetical protein RHGRI_015128 [Rhododendron griersonianum]
MGDVFRYEKYHCYYGGDEKERKANYADMVLDVGCGIGGPLREIAQFSMTSITGLNNNEYQITRGKLLDRKAGVLDKTCDYVKADFMKMPFPDNSYDAAYAIEATCHAPDAVIWERDIGADSPLPWYLPLDTSGFSLSSFRVTAAGRFVTRNMVLDVGCGIGGPLREIARFSMTSITGLNNNEYQITRGKADFMKMPFPDNSFDAAYALEATCHAPDAKEIELGNGLTDVRTRAQCLEALKQVGFELMALEYVGLAPKGSQRVQAFLEKAADGLFAGGR